MRRHRTLAVGAAVLSLAAVALGVSTGTAAAAPAPRHCTLDTATGEQHCYTEYSQAIGSLRSSLAAQPRGDVIQGTFFDGADFTGDSLTITGPELCVKDGVINWQYDLGDDWKNKITSVQAWGNCWIWLYPEPGLNGDRDGPFKDNTGNIGSFMDNRTQSIGFS